MPGINVREDEIKPTELAPCHSLLIEPSELGLKYPKYYAEMHNFMHSDVEKLAGRISRRWPRNPINKDYTVVMRIPKHRELTGASQIEFIRIVMAKGAHYFMLTQDAPAFDAMERQMKIFYEDIDSKQRDPRYVIACGLFQGNYYAVYSRIRRSWVRCLCHTDVPVIKSKSMACVTLLDYGCKETVDANQVRPLTPGFCKLPAQGYVGSLSLPTIRTPTLSDPVLCEQFRSNVFGNRYYGLFFDSKPPLYVSFDEKKVRCPHVELNLFTLDKCILGGDGKKFNALQA